MPNTLETIHNAHRLAIVSSTITTALQQVASVLAQQNGVGSQDIEAMIEQIQNAVAAADSSASLVPIDASPEELAQVYQDFCRPLARTPATAGSPSLPEMTARQLEDVANLHWNAVVATVGDADPAQMPAHFRNALWMALACQDAIRQAAAAARKAGYSNLIIAGH